MPELYAIGFRKADEALNAKVEEILSDMAKDGKLSEITVQWFGKDISLLTVDAE